MGSTLTEISIERLLKQDLPDSVTYHNHIILANNLGDMKLFSHPARLKATTVLICTQGYIDCSINLKNYIVKENHLLVNFSGDIIQINNTHEVKGYAIILSEEYLQKLQLDFRLHTQNFINLRGNGPIEVPHDELTALKPYYILFRKNMQEENSYVIRGLALALSHTIISLMKQYQPNLLGEGEVNISRAQQLFKKFMQLVNNYHDQERSLQFYADKMFLTPKYISGMIKSYSGKSALDWINEYVMLEARMMLRYTDMTVQEIAYQLNFPTQSAFGKYFKQQVGVSPKKYRIEK